MHDARELGVDRGDRIYHDRDVGQKGENKRFGARPPDHNGGDDPCDSKSFRWFASVWYPIRYDHMSISSSSFLKTCSPFLDIVGFFLQILLVALSSLVLLFVVVEPSGSDQLVPGDSEKPGGVES